GVHLGIPRRALVMYIVNLADSIIDNNGRLGEDVRVRAFDTFARQFMDLPPQPPYPEPYSELYTKVQVVAKILVDLVPAYTNELTQLTPDPVRMLFAKNILDYPNHDRTLRDGRPSTQITDHSSL